MYESYQRQYDEPSQWPYYLIAIVAATIMCVIVGSSLRDTLMKISREFVVIPAEQVWLTLIPFFGTFWMFYMIWHVANGLKAEFKQRNIVEFETAPGLGSGWVFSFLFLSTQLVVFTDAYIVVTLMFVVTLTMMIVYLLRLSSFRSKLDQTRVQPFETFHQPVHHPQQQWPPHVPPAQDVHFPPPGNIPPAGTPPPDDWERWRPKP